MRFKLFIGMLAFLLLLTTITAFAEKNPLSVYSTQWNKVCFERANTAANNKQLTQIEKEFIHIVNLARLSPSLFRQTVLTNYFSNHAYSEAAVTVLNKMTTNNFSALLYPSAMLINQVQSIVQNIPHSTSTDQSESTNYSYILPDSVKGMVTTIKSNTVLNLLLEMLTSSGEQGYVFRNLFSGNENRTGITITNTDDQAYLVAILIDESEIMKSKQFEVDLKNNPDDAVLNFFINKPVNKNLISRLADTIYFNKESVFLSKDAMKSMKDYLSKNNISHRTSEFNYYVDELKTQQRRDQNSIAADNYYYTTFHAGTSINNIEADSVLDYYYVGRTSETDDASTKVTIIHLTSDGPTPAFPKDSIGIFNGSESFSKVDSVVKNLGNVDESKLGIFLTKPLKTTLDKVRAIFYWMHTNIQYDYVGLALDQPTYEVPDIFKKRVAVCEGYANLFNHLCEQAGILSIKIHGITPPGEHAWNAVNINKKWYLIDVTWGEKYFLMHPDEYIQDHYPVMRKWTLLTNPPSLKAWRATYIDQMKEPAPTSAMQAYLKDLEKEKNQ